MASQSWGEMEERQQSGGKVNWVDIDDDEGAYEADTYLPPPEVTEDEKTGTKTVVEYRIENGKKVKVTSKYKIVNKTKKVSKGVSLCFLDFFSNKFCVQSEGLPRSSVVTKELTVTLWDISCNI